MRVWVLQATLSVTAPPCHLSRKGEALAGAKSFPLIGWLLLPLTGEEERVDSLPLTPIREYSYSPDRGSRSKG